MLGEIGNNLIKQKVTREFFMIPRGVEHLPIAKEEVQVMLIEPKSTLNTGNIVNEKTIEKLDWI